MENAIIWYRNQIEEAQFYRLGIMAFILLVQANIIIPATLLVISMNNGSTIAFVSCTLFSFAVLISLLAVMPAKVIIPLFIVSTIVHVFIIASCIL
ncbi:hypothetical protein [Catalinimonas niigatensis]|uniref:hypothetical protein n=1 Tax=Catalinimonas niigatensis TaxID=1397264 RepID=UPI002664FC49|nr:hypothetical protein [Catalinimonas niigatensis]WPP50720.1 hypothetical protein PZB72_29075 [Catalinimonas niigatensis]